MKSLKIFSVAVLTGLLFSSCGSFHLCDAYSYNDEPVNTKKLQELNDDSMLEMEIEVTYSDSRI